jgi:hypothetical protein
VPILARFAPDPAPASPWLDSRSLTLRTIIGADEQPFTGGGSWAGSYDWVLLPGATGLGLASRELIVETSPGLDGGWLRGRTVGPRQVFLPLFIASPSSHVDYLGRRERLFGFLDEYAVEDMTRTDGTLELVADSALGQRLLRVAYAGGLEGDEGTDTSGRYWCKVGLNLTAVDPYWRATDETVLSFTNTPGRVFLSTTGAARWPRRIVPAVSLAGGGLAVTVPGNVPVWPTIEVTGPTSSTTVTWPGPLGEATAVQIGAVGAGQTLLLSTDPRRRYARLDGDEAWSLIGPAPQFGRLKTGAQTIGVATAGTSGSTAVNIRFRASYRSAW